MKTLRASTRPAGSRGAKAPWCAAGLFLLVGIAFAAADVHAAWPAVPHGPADMGAADRPRVVLLTASWCLWCQVTKQTSLKAGQVKDVLARRYTPFEVDVDRAPEWLELPEVGGLPAFVFFDRTGNHVLSRSGHRPAEELAILLEAIADRMVEDPYAPYPRSTETRAWPTDSIDPRRAARELTRIERRLFILVNSNEGGFGSPARRPHPRLLVELQRWRSRGAPRRVGTWIDLTVQNALVGTSPRLAGEPAPGMDFSGPELVKLAQSGSPRGTRWLDGVETLATKDPYRGLQDPVDGGVFRYAAWGGFFHPHFERRAEDNLAWVRLLRLRGDAERAKRVMGFVRRTLVDEAGVRASQRSDPFYYRLRKNERRGVTPPQVDDLYLLQDQASAARLDPTRCPTLHRAAAEEWPRARWRRGRPDPDAPDAPADAVGELLSALAHCPADESRALGRRLAAAVVERWTARGMHEHPRLMVLAQGLCDAAPARCGHALAAVEGIEVDPAHPPPVMHLARWARR